MEDLDHQDRRLVAKGIVQNLGSIVHHQQMANDELRVSVEEVIIDAPVLLPTGEVKVVSDVIRTFISWPANLVHVSTPPEAPALPELVGTAKLSAKDKFVLMVSNKQVVVCNWSVNIEVCLKNKLAFYVDEDDIISLLFDKQELTDAIILMFIK